MISDSLVFIWAKISGFSVARFFVSPMSFARLNSSSGEHSCCQPGGGRSRPDKRRLGCRTEDERHYRRRKERACCRAASFALAQPALGQLRRPYATRKPLAAAELDPRGARSFPAI